MYYSLRTKEGYCKRDINYKEVRESAPANKIAQISKNL